MSKGTKLNSDYLESISSHFSQVNLGWLITGKGEPFLPESGQVSEPFINSQKNISGIAQAGAHSNATQHNYTISDCEKERDAFKSERDVARNENDLLRQQLTMTQALIAAKDETLTLLRASRNNSN